VVLSLSSLAGWEDAVLASIGGASGSLEERDRQIERSGMYGEYPAIVRAYAEMELPSVTGIAPLPDGTARSIMDALDARIARGATDDELAWMLAWYHAQGPYVLELYGATPRVLTFAEAGRANGWEGAAITPARMAQRGQLGRYWTSLAAGAP
jgi:hypothetical protein